MPAYAGSFYPATQDACLADISGFLRFDSGGLSQNAEKFGGVVPHAGWSYSGAVAGVVLEALSEEPASTYVLLGASHHRLQTLTAVCASGSWITPLGEIQIDQSLASELLDACPGLHEDTAAHAMEHSLEVQIPFIQHLRPDARIVPILIQPAEGSAEVGRQIGSCTSRSKAGALLVASSDLTHYGPRYGFMPEGAGAAGLTWARDVNDRRMIDLLLEMREEEIVPEARRNRNACGAGALAATVAACKACGATQGTLLAHRTSNDVDTSLGRRSAASASDAVGYAGIVFH